MFRYTEFGNTAESIRDRGLFGGAGGRVPTSVVRRYPLLAFYLLACAITWSVWVPQAAYWGGLLPFKVPAIFLAIGAFGPTLSAIILTAVNGGKASLRELLDRLLLWRVGAKWYILALFLGVSIGLSAIALHLLLGGRVSEIATPFPWYLLLPAFLGHLLTASLGEEIGWRGYALPRLQARSSALAASLVLGGLWGFWHLPSFWMSAGKYFGLPFIWFLLGTLPLAILFTWLFNNTNGSLLIAVLFHGASNFAFILPILPAVAGELRPFKLYVGLLWIVAIVVVAVEGPTRLSRRAAAPETLQTQNR